MTWTLSHSGGTEASLADLLLAWSDDGARAVLVRGSGSAFRAGSWTLAFTLSLDVGAERAAWRRGGSGAPEGGSLVFDLA